MKRSVTIKRVYDPPDATDGARILVDRVWPRGLTRKAAALEAWLKEIAPSTPLRKWFSHRPERWEEFRSRYARELKDNPFAVAALRRWLDAGPVTLLFSAKERECNNAAALLAFLQRKSTPRAAAAHKAAKHKAAKRKANSKTRRGRP